MVVGCSQVGVRNVIRHEGETLEHGIVHAGAFETTVDRVSLERHFCDTQAVVRKVSVKPRAQMRRRHTFSSRFLQPRPKKQGEASKVQPVKSSVPPPPPKARQPLGVLMGRVPQAEATDEFAGQKGVHGTTSGSGRAPTRSKYKPAARR